jgi:hypothetical protein
VVQPLKAQFYTERERSMPKEEKVSGQIHCVDIPFVKIRGHAAILKHAK